MLQTRPLPAWLQAARRRLQKPYPLFERPRM